MIRKDIQKINKVDTNKYSVTVHCEECGKAETQTVDKGVNVYCPHCDNFVMDGMDWEDIEESEQDDSL